MSTEVHAKKEEEKGTPKRTYPYISAANRWTNISSDED